MKIERKKEIKIVRISHNWKLLMVIIILLVFLGILIYFILQNKGKGDNENDNARECLTDSDCAPVCGCHPNSCIPISKKSSCERIFCSMECSGPLDCRAGYCGCANGKCSVVSNPVK